MEKDAETQIGARVKRTYATLNSNEWRRRNYGMERVYEFAPRIFRK